MDAKAVFGSVLASLCGVSVLWVVSASAEVVTFDEFPASNNDSRTLKSEYGYTGARFRTTDDGAVWAGVSGGDPGGFGLEGSDGPAFMGFNGASLSATLNLESPSNEFRLDSARGINSRSGNTLILFGYLDGVFVESVTHRYGGINQWDTIALTQTVDRVVWFAGGTEPFDFGIDNLRWEGPLGDVGPPEPEPERLDASIDVKPWRAHNRVNLRSRGVLPILLRGTDLLAAAHVDPYSVVFGPGEAAHPRRRRPLVGDFDHDGHTDMLFLPRVRELGLEPGVRELCAWGLLRDGREFFGCDEVHGVNPFGFEFQWSHRRRR